jgi:predicted nucleic-acid-binding Zn-ribbon protein
MSEKKPIPALALRGAHDCPVCGKRSYSATGIHPQCAMVQADAPRKRRLAAEKAKEKKEKPRSDSQNQTAWQKTCPKCGARRPAQGQDCTCGHKFSAS